MIKMNMPMKKLYNNFNQNSVVSKLFKEIENTVNRLIDRISILNTYLIINKPTFNIYDDTKIKKIFGDKVGLEASLNEINLNCEFNAHLLSNEVAFAFFELFNSSLKKTYNREFCAYLSKDNTNIWIYRFHTITDEKELWINPNIEMYKEAIMYDVF